MKREIEEIDQLSSAAEFWNGDPDAGWQYEWIICDLTFIPKEGLTAPVHIEISEFDLLSNDDQKIASYANPDLYVGQMHDMSGGIDVAGPDPVPGTVAFPIYPGQVEAPFLLAWRTSGDFIIADELEPQSSEFFIRDMQA